VSRVRPCRRQIAPADLDTERHALQLPFVELEAGSILGPIVDPDANAGLIATVTAGEADVESAREARSPGRGSATSPPAAPLPSRISASSV
jgi:hypothetical protein